MITIGTDKIKLANSVRNLGIHWDSKMKNTIHCNKLSLSLYVTIKNITKIRPYLDIDMTWTIIQGLILWRLDYCNSTLAGMSGKNMEKLERIQSMSWHIMQCLQKYNHISRPLKDLHWLKVPQRINFKLATLMFKCMQGTVPSYLMDLVITPHSCPLRSISGIVIHHQMYCIHLSQGGIQLCGSKTKELSSEVYMRCKLYRTI